jgi:hypothetical protein
MAEDTEEKGSPAARGPWGKPTFVASAAFVALIVIVLLVVLVAGRGDPTGTKQPVRAGAPPTAQHRTPATAPATSVPDSPPRHVEWRLYHTVALPYSSVAGPRHVTSAVASGYAHTPTGALLAAAQIPTRTLIAPDWRSVVHTQVAPGAGRKAYLAKRARVASAAASPGQLGQLAGYKFVNYTPMLATIEFVTRFASGSMQVTTTTMEWRDGDWRQILQPGGSESPNAHAVRNLAGFVEWGGV